MTSNNTTMRPHISPLSFILCIASLLCTSTHLAAQDEAGTPLPLPTLSAEHGFYDEPFTLAMTSASGLPCHIVYTTDCSTPSPTNGIRYTSPISITKTTVIRAIALPEEVDGTQYLPSTTVTATYLFPRDVLTQGNTPEGYPTTWGPYTTIDGTAVADYEMDPEITGMSGMKEKILGGLSSLPVVSLVTDKDNLFSHEEDEERGGIYIYTGASASYGDGYGRGWTRAASVEVFADADRYPDFGSIQANCAIKLHGNASRMAEKTPKHSIRLQFKSDYGVSKLRFPMFQDDVPMMDGAITKKANKYNQLVLRAGFGNTWLHWTTGQQRQALYTRDAWAKRVMTQMGHIASRTTYMHLFINGMYWGLYNPTERVDDDFCELRMGGDKTEYDVIRKAEDGSLEVQYGTGDAYKTMFEMAVGSANFETYQKMRGLNTDGTRNPAYPIYLDVDNFIDYMLVNQYGGNGDWDHHNWVAVRRQGPLSKGFRWVPWDSELVLQGLNDNVLGKNNKNCPSALFYTLMTQSNHFRQTYNDRLHLRCGEPFGALSPDSAYAVWKRLDNSIDQAMYCESARWGDYRRDVHPYTSAGQLYTKEGHYDKQKKQMVEQYFPQRSEVLIQQVAETDWYSTVTAPQVLVNGTPLNTYQDTIEVTDLISIQGTGLRYYTTDGTDPLKWSKTGTAKRPALSDACRQPFSLAGTCTLRVRQYANSQWSPLVERHLVVNGSTSIHQPQQSGEDTFRAYDLSGRLLPAKDLHELPHGIYIIRYKGATKKVMR